MSTVASNCGSTVLPCRQFKKIIIISNKLRGEKKERKSQVQFSARVAIALELLYWKRGSRLNPYMLGAFLDAQVLLSAALHACAHLGIAD